jgi:hypothetical protein
MLSRVIYVSRASSALPLELKDILASSRKNNPRLGVSGAMCFIDGVYLQCLEGEASVVDALYQRIEKDARHTGPKMLEKKAVSERAFPGWAMALLTWNEETKKVYSTFNPDSGLDVYLADPATIEPLMRTWAATSNWMTL